MTKAEVVARIAANGFADLIPDTRSCTRVRDMTILHPHCGHCSQCIDRRFAVLAAGQGQNDPVEAYKVELFTGEWPAGRNREMALAYVRSASQVNRMTDVAFFSRYCEASRAVETYAEVAHEAVFKRWEKLRDWIAAEREFLAWRTGLEAARRAWLGAMYLYEAYFDYFAIGVPLANASLASIGMSYMTRRC